MATKIFVNLPVRDLERSKEFYGRLGYSFHPQFTDERAACLVISEHIFAMLLVEPFFRTFTRKEVVDADTGIESIVSLSAESRAEVDELADRALAAGGRPAMEPMDMEGMYGRSFLDPDGHQWEVVHMDMSAVQG
ncbi:VOC family protein [Streptomyces mayteni]